MANYFAQLCIGTKRALKSPGPLSRWQENLGSLRRVEAAAIKLGNIGLTALTPLGIKLELLQRALVAPASISPRRLIFAKKFFQAFSNATAKEFARQTLTGNYFAQIMRHHPKAATLNPQEIRKKCERLVLAIFSRLEDTQKSPQFLFDILKSMSRKVANREQIWFSEFDEAYEHYKETDQPQKRDQQLFVNIVGGSVVDIGCGRGHQVADLKRRHPGYFKRLAGIEVFVRPDQVPGLEFYSYDFSIPGMTSPHQFETGLLLAVLHHACETEDQLKVFLTGAGTAVKYRLLVQESVLITTEDISSGLLVPERITELKTTQAPLAKYLSLSPQTQKDATIIMDLLGNSLTAGVPEMAFPSGFRSITDWVKNFNESGFNVNNIIVLGFQEKFNALCHVLFVLDKAN